MAAVMNPPVPYNAPLMTAGRSGTLLQINGFIPPNAEQFAVNLRGGGDDIAFHLNPRFHQNTLVMNTFMHGNWGSEERVSLGPLQCGRPFELKILIEHDKIMVAIDGNHHCHFHHRLPKEHIQRIEIGGSVQLQYCGQANAMVGVQVPFSTPIHGGLMPGRRIVVHAACNGGQAGQINLQCGMQPYQNIGLHISLRLNERVVVFNDMTGGWGGEERAGLNLQPGQNFVLEITVHHHAYEIRLNGATIANFNHRNLHARPLHSINVLHIDGGINVSRVEI